MPRAGAAIIAVEEGPGEDERGAGLPRRAVAFANGTLVIAEATAEIAPGERVLIDGRVRHRQVHPVPRHRGLWPWGAGEIRMPPREQHDVHAAAALSAARARCAARSAYPRRRTLRRSGGGAALAPRSAWPHLDPASSTRRSAGTRSCRSASSSGSPSRGCCCTSRAGSSWTRRPRRSTRRTRTAMMQLFDRRVAGERADVDRPPAGARCLHDRTMTLTRGNNGATLAAGAAAPTPRSGHGRGQGRWWRSGAGRCRRLLGRPST